MNTNNFSTYSTTESGSNAANVRNDLEIEYYGNHSDSNSLLVEISPPTELDDPQIAKKRRRRRRVADIIPEHAVKCEILEPDNHDNYNGFSQVEGDPIQVEEGQPERVRRRRRRSSVKAETEEERANRLSKMSAYAAQRLANETAEQRALRLRRMSAYAAQRLASESPEQRAARLQRMSAYAARRIAAESPDQRAARLARMAAYAAKRHATKKSVTTPNNQQTPSNEQKTS